MNLRILKTTVASAALLTAPLAANALTISTETDGDVLADALFLNIPGLTVTSTELIGFPGQGGLYTNVIGTYGLPQHGIVFSSGDVLDYQAGGNADAGTSTSYGFGGEGGGGNGTGGGCGAGVGNGNGQGCEGIVPQAAQFAEIVIPASNAATPSQDALLQPITSEGNHNDVIKLNIEFETASNV